MTLKIILILISFYPLLKGLFYLWASEHNCIPYKNFVKYKTKDSEEYEYKNKQAGILYTKLGAIVGVFLTIVNILYNFPPKAIMFYVFGIWTLQIIFFDGILYAKFLANPTKESNDCLDKTSK